MADVPTLSASAPAWGEAGARGLATADMTGRQALERNHPTLAMESGGLERRACAYMRRGPGTVLAHCDGAQGTGRAPSLGPTRPAEDVVHPMIRTIASAPAATRWHGVADTLHSHQSESLGRLAAAREKRSEDLGHTGTRGLLRSLSMRAAFLADPPHPMVFHSTPKHASRMNHMELWCSLLMRQFLKRASCTSVEDLQARILAFLPYCNATMAKPFTWTYGQTPLYV